MMGKTLEEQLAFLRTCETGFVTDAVNLLGIQDCWIEGLLPLRSMEKIMVGEAFTARLTLVRDINNVHSYNPTNLYQVVNECPPGKVLVVSDIHTTFLIGANVMTRAYNKQIEGVVVEARNRDAAEVRKLPMPVFSQGVGIKVLPTTLKVICETKVPIDLGGAKIYPNDIVLGDDDGVIVIPRDRLEDVIYQLQMIADVEKEASTANRNQPNMSVENYMAIIAKKKKLRK
jgi:regulator of RNase E activity RraA